MDPDELLEKPRYKIEKWLRWRNARRLFAGWQQESADASAEAAMKRAMEGNG